MSQGVEIRLANIEDAFELADNLHPLDVEEVGISGRDPLDAILYVFARGFASRTHTALLDGRPMAIGGVIPQNPMTGIPWLLVHREFPSGWKRLARPGLRFFYSRMSEFAFCHNLCIDRPERTDFLRRIGFDIGGRVSHSAGVGLRHFRWSRSGPKDRRRPA